MDDNESICSLIEGGSLELSYIDFMRGLLLEIEKGKNYLRFTRYAMKEEIFNSFYSRFCISAANHVLFLLKASSISDNNRC